MMLLPMVAMADPVEIDGIYYNLISKGNTHGAEVTYKPFGEHYYGSIVIPSVVTYNGEEYSVTSIGDGTFANCSGLTSVTIPNSVTSIGDSAFGDCTGLTSVTIGNSVTSIGDRAFWGCSGLTSVTIPNSVTSIGDGAFSSCYGLTSVTIPNSVTSIGNFAFSYCPQIATIVVESGNSVYDSRDGCNAIISTNDNTLIAGCKNAIIPISVTSIGMGAFRGCSGLTSVTIPNSVTSIGGSAFQDCSGLTSVTIGNSVTSIGSSTFSGCRGLTSVTIPNSVTSIGGYAFYNCSGLTSVHITDIAAWCNISFGDDVSNPLSYAHHLYMNGSEITDLVIPNSVTSIGIYAFRDCSGLTSVTIPNSVTSIGGDAFISCTSLTSVTIGSGISSIGKWAFAFCKNLTDVYCYAESVPQTDAGDFYGSNIEYATLHVPDASVNAYKQAEPWKNFKSIVGIGGGTPDPQKCEKPTISYKNGQLMFASATEGVEFISEITDNDIKKYYEATVTLTVTYNISVYATKTGYDNSDVAYATLCWIDTDPKTEGITDGVAQVPSQAVLIQSEGGILTVRGIDDGTQVSIYGIDGTEAGSAIGRNGEALIGTNLKPGSVAIVKIGKKSVKVITR